MIHELKVFPCFFEEILTGKKRFEVRKADRPFAVGDLLALNEYDGFEKRYTGRSCVVGVDYMLSDPEYVKEGYVILGIRPCEVVWEHDEDPGVPLATGYMPEWREGDEG